MPHCWRSEGYDPRTTWVGCQAHGSIAQFAVSASSQALQDAQFVINELNAEQVGGDLTGIGGIKVLEEQQTVYLNRGRRCSLHGANDDC